MKQYLVALAALGALACSHDDDLDALNALRNVVPTPAECVLTLQSPQEQASVGELSDADPNTPGVQVQLSFTTQSCNEPKVQYGLCLGVNVEPPADQWKETDVNGTGPFNVLVTLLDKSGPQFPCVKRGRLITRTVQRVCEGDALMCTDGTCRENTQTDATHCGASCEDCTTKSVPNGSNSCVEGKCTPKCDSGYVQHEGTCRARPSCKGLEAICSGQDCCAEDRIDEEPGQVLRVIRGYDKSEDSSATASWQPSTSAPVSVDPFYMDRYEVTVGRFRRFVEAYEGWRAGSNPKNDSGQHPKISGSGWQPPWDVLSAEGPSGPQRVMPKSKETLLAMIKAPSCANLHSWTDKPADHEDLAMNCVTFFLASAFCAWDGDTQYGRLPTEAEWHAAASGGSKQQRAYPWSDPASSLAIEGFADFNQQDRLPSPVGARPKGVSRWGTFDLSGNVYEWMRDTGHGAGLDPNTGEFLTSYNAWDDIPNMPNNPIRLIGDAEPTTQRVLKGGSFKKVDCACEPQVKLRVVARTLLPGTAQFNDVGFRCVRNY